MGYDNNNSGGLWKNDKKNPADPEDKKPDYTGQAEVNSVEYWISAWVRTGKESGRKFFSLKFEPKDKERKTNNDIPF